MTHYHRLLSAFKARLAPRGSLLRLVKLVLANVAALVLLAVVVEGLVSTLLLGWDIVTERVNPERRHTMHDAELGWVAIPNLHIPDMYGPGVDLRTNSRGFRGDAEVSATVPRGKFRVVCSGDSVTLGFGVDDHHSWCKLLESLDQRLETVNMGQSGYGVDQAYLWYKRDAGTIRHHVHLFAPIVDDFRRMQSSTFFGGYSKPILEIDDGSLVVKNVPVPAKAYSVPWLTEAAQHLRSLRTIQVLERLRPTSGRPPANPTPTDQNERTARVVAMLLEDLKRVNEERSSSLVLVYLPTLDELDSEDANFWSTVLGSQSQRLGIPFINLVEEFKRLPVEEARTLYLDTDLGHFSTKGNEYVATLIYRKLRTFPEISRFLFTGDRLDRAAYRAASMQGEPQSLARRSSDCDAGRRLVHPVEGRPCSSPRRAVTQDAPELEPFLPAGAHAAHEHSESRQHHTGK